jgi:hypothetical protein
MLCAYMDGYEGVLASEDQLSFVSVAILKGLSMDADSRSDS